MGTEIEDEEVSGGSRGRGRRCDCDYEDEIPKGEEVLMSMYALWRRGMQESSQSYCSRKLGFHHEC